MSRLHTIALIVAAGKSERFGAETPKPYLALAEKPVLRHTVEAFLSHPGIDGVRVVISRAHHPLYKKAVEGLTLFPPVVGGDTRQESVRRGLSSIARCNPEYVLVHDAARPLVSHGVIGRVLEGLTRAPAVLPALAVTDTLRRNGDLVDRGGMTAAQTPQGFHFALFMAAHTQLKGEALTDDIALAERCALAVEMVAGERANMKLTTPDDLAFMTQLAIDNAIELRSGIGFDVHPFAEHDADKPDTRKHTAICGVKVPYPKRLKGNSDADVGLHSLVDAILGAIGEGDIGMHFQADDPQWAGADSSRFLIYAYQLLKQKGGDIVNIDITIIGEAPKVGPYRQEMRARIADILKISPSRVNVKGCTTEKMGFLGRGEGLAAQAIALVRVPASL